MKMHHSTRHGNQLKRVVHLAVPALLLCAPPVLQAATNWVAGAAYGRNYQALATAASISSRASTNGSLIVGHGATTNLTLTHHITGYIIVTNEAPNFTVKATGATVEGNLGAVFGAQNATNLVITGGRFIGTEGADGTLPPIPGQPSQSNSTTAATGGILFNSVATIDGSEFSGTNATDGLYMELTALTVSNGTFRGGSSGTGLVARNRSAVTIHSGSFTGGAGNTAFYLQNSDATVYGGTFSGNTGGTNLVAGDGLFSKLTEATTNHVALHGGDFSSLAFYNADGAVQHFLAGTNLVVRNGIIQDGGLVLVDNQNDTALRNLSIQGGGVMSFGTSAYSLVDGGVLSFGIDEATNGSLVAGSAYLHTNATIKVTASGLPSGENNITLLSTDSGLFMVGATTNIATGTDFSSNNVEVAVAGRSRLKAIFVDNDRDLRFQFTTKTLKEHWNATGVFGDFTDELETIGNPTMMGIIDSYDNPETSKTLTEQTYFGSMNTFLVSMQGLQAAVGQSVTRGAEFREQLKLHPKGAKGPPEINNKLRGWAKYYGQFLSHDADGLNAEYDATLHGGVVGYDKSFGSLLLGMSGGAGNYRITSGSDAEENIRAYHGSVYGTYGTERAYFDGGIAYGFNQVESCTDVPFVLDSEFDAQILSAYFGAGYDLVDTKGGTVFTPEASIQYTQYKQDAYSETSTTAVPRNIDAFDTDSLRSSLGLNVSMLNTTAFETFGFKLDGRFHWMHEFNPEPGNISFGLEGGSGGSGYQLAAPLLDEETFRAGFGFSFFNTLRQKPKNVLLRLDFDELFGSGFNSHNLSAKVIYAF